MNADREAAIRREANALMAACAGGDGGSFGRFYRLLADRIYAYVLRRVGDEALALDLTQQTFMHVFQARGTYDPARSALSWTYSIAHHLVVDFFRRSGREVVADSDGGVPDVEVPRGAADEQLIAAQLGARIHGALSKLPESQRSAFEYVDIEGHSYREAAETMGITETALTALLHRARSKLRALLAEERD